MKTNYHIQFTVKQGDGSYKVEVRTYDPPLGTKKEQDKAANAFALELERKMR